MRGPAAKYATLAGVVSLVGVMGLLPMWLRNKMGARPASADGGFARRARPATSVSARLAHLRVGEMPHGVADPARPVHELGLEGRRAGRARRRPNICDSMIIVRLRSPTGT